MVDRQVEREIQFWLDFLQSNISNLSIEKKSAYLFKVHALFGLQKGDVGNIEEKIFKVYEEGFRDLQNTLLKYFDKILDLQKNSTTSYFTLPKINRFAAVFDGKLTATLSATESILFDETTQKFNIDPDILVLRVFDLMMGRSIHIIKRCVTCGKLFCYLPKKNKLYCSTACRWRASKQRYRARKST